MLDLNEDPCLFLSNTKHTEFKSMRLLHIPTLLLCLSTILLVGCMQPAAPRCTLAKEKRLQLLHQMHCWTIEGRIAINDPQQNITASFKWQQQQENFNVRFYSAFSSDSVTIAGNQTQFKVVASSGDDVQLEKNLPLPQLSAWLKGMVATMTTATKTTYDRYNQLQTLQQDGWLIEYQNYLDLSPVSLPEKLTITDGQIKAKILIKNWQK